MAAYGRVTIGAWPKGKGLPGSCLSALEHMRESVWKVRPIGAADLVSAKLAPGKRSCLGLMHPAPDSDGAARRKEKPTRRSPFSSAGPEPGALWAI